MPDDETVNQMIARSEDEFDQFMVSVLKIVLKCSPPALTKIFSLHMTSVDLFSISPSHSVWTLTAVVRKPVTRGENLV